MLRHTEGMRGGEGGGVFVRIDFGALQGEPLHLTRRGIIYSDEFARHNALNTGPHMQRDTILVTCS